MEVKVKSDIKEEILYIVILMDIAYVLSSRFDGYKKKRLFCKKSLKFIKKHAFVK